MDQQTAGVVIAGITAMAGIATAVLTKGRNGKSTDNAPSESKTSLEVGAIPSGIGQSSSSTSGHQKPMMSEYVSRSDEALLRGWERLLERLQTVVQQQAEELQRTQDRNDELREMVDRLQNQHTVDQESIRMLRLKLDESEADLSDAIRRIGLQEQELMKLKHEIEKRRTNG